MADSADKIVVAESPNLSSVPGMHHKSGSFSSYRSQSKMRHNSLDRVIGSEQGRQTCDKSPTSSITPSNPLHSERDHIPLTHIDRQSQEPVNEIVGDDSTAAKHVQFRSESPQPVQHELSSPLLNSEAHPRTKPEELGLQVNGASYTHIAPRRTSLPIETAKKSSTNCQPNLPRSGEIEAEPQEVNATLPRGAPDGTKHRPSPSDWRRFKKRIRTHAHKLIDWCLCDDGD